MSTLRPTSPSGGEWAVGVPLLPWSPRRRWRRRRDDGHVDVIDLPGPGGDRRSGSADAEADGFVGDGPEVDAPSGGGGGLDFLPFDFLDEAAVLLVVVGAVVLLWVSLSWLLPLAVLAIEVVLLALAFGGVALVRTLMRVPWPVRAEAPDGSNHQWQTVGYRRARRAARAIADRIATGGTLPPDGHFDPDQRVS